MTLAKPSFNPFVVKRQRDLLLFIAKEVSAFFDIPESVFFSKDNRHEVSFARQCFMAYSKDVFGYTLVQIAAPLKRHHTSVIAGRQRLYNLTYTDKNYADQYKEMVDYLTNIAIVKYIEKTDYVKTSASNSQA